MAEKRNRSRKGNKHASNARRKERKHLRSTGIRVGKRGNCGSSFCSRATGCEPWK